MNGALTQRLSTAAHEALRATGAKADLEVAIDAAVAKFNENEAETRNKKQSHGDEQNVVAFSAQYVGDADNDFRTYLATCCSVYRDIPGKYTAPYVTVIQSSGFGKSRILQRLTEGGNLIHNNVEYATSVLYVCMRDTEGSTGYPRATRHLSNWLFPARSCTPEGIKSALLRAFKYALDHPNAGEHWQKLFDNMDDGNAFDVTVVEELERVCIQESVSSPEVVRKKQRTTGTSQTQSQPHSDAKIPMLVVTIDDAWPLLKIKGTGGDNAFRMLRRALKGIHKSEQVHHANGSVFGILVDTRSQVHDFVPSLVNDPSSRDGDTALFPSFTLTRTMDVMLDKFVLDNTLLRTSKPRVLNTNQDQVWEALVSMGRSLWRSMEEGTSLKGKQEGLNTLAASKLLLGNKTTNAGSYNDTTLHGVESLFCRVGLRPRASHPMATRLVADFMSVLHYVTYKNDAHISGYASDPILTFGASRMWYQLKAMALESQILPQFQNVLLNGVVDAGDIGELVARIFLLLTMDAALMGTEATRNAETREKFVFSGQFCQVPSFVETLVGTDPVPRADKSKRDEKAAKLYSDWIKTWENWKVGFSHFVDLPDEPTKETL